MYYYLRLRPVSHRHHYMILGYVTMSLIAPWWRHQMETFSALLAICAGNSLVTGEFPAQRPMTRSLMFSLICAWITGWVNNDEAGDLKRHRALYDVTVMLSCFGPGFFCQNTSGCVLVVLIPKDMSSGWVFSQTQHPIIKTYNISLFAVSPIYGIIFSL